MAFFTQSRHKGPGRFLRIKVWLFSIAAILMLVGMAREIDLLIAAAIALLAVAFGLRFFEKEDEEELAGDDEWDDDEDADPDALPPPAGLRELRERPAAEPLPRRHDDDR